MSEVRITLGGRKYTIACADGQEDHIAELAAMLNDKLEQQGGTVSVQEAQNLLFAGLYLADDLHEARRQLAVLSDAARTQAEAGSSAADEAAPLRAQCDALERRVDDLTRELAEAQSAAQARAGEAAELRGQLEAAGSTHKALEEDNAALRELIASMGPMAEMEADTDGDTGGEAEETSAALFEALESFAQSLEDCAEKLESSSATP